MPRSIHQISHTAFVTMIAGNLMVAAVGCATRGAPTARPSESILSLSGQRHMATRHGGIEDLGVTEACAPATGGRGRYFRARRATGQPKGSINSDFR